MATGGNPHGNGYLTATEAGRLAGVPGRTVRHWAARGKVGTIDGPTGRLVLLRDVKRLAAETRQPLPEVAMARVATLPEPLPPGLPPIATEEGSGAALLGQAIAALAARAEAADQRADAERARADALAGELRRERDARLAAEWEAARLRPLTALPEEPAVRRRRWWHRG